MSEQLGVQDVTVAYRRAAQAVAREHGFATTGVIINGAIAAGLRRRELESGEATATAEALAEQLCEDSLVTAAADELGVVRTLSVATWLSDNWSGITERAAAAPVGQAFADTPEEAAYRSVAAQMALPVAGDHRVARAVLAGAAAVARLRRHSRSDVEGSTEDQLREMAETDPAVAAAWDELDDADRRGPGNWVIGQWDEICEAAEELAALNSTARLWMRAEQRMEILEREMENDTAREKVEVPYLYLQEASTAERYRAAGEQFARERGYNVAECTYAGVCAETWYRCEVSDSVMGTLPGVQLEVICGDPLASRSTAEVGTIAALRFMDWVRHNWEEIGKLAETVKVSRWRNRKEALSETAMKLASSTSISSLPTAAMLYTGAVAALRYNHPGLRDRVDQEMARAEADEPLLALARPSMSDAERTARLAWVEANWDEIAPAAADLVHAEDNAAHGPSSDQVELITRHEVRHWLRTNLPEGAVLSDASRAYLEAAAVLAVKYPDLSADDASMRIHVRIDEAVQATDADNVLTEDLRAQLREAARIRWAPLAEALND